MIRAISSFKSNNTNINFASKGSLADDAQRAGRKLANGAGEAVKPRPKPDPDEFDNDPPMTGPQIMMRLAKNFIDGVWQG